jgi:hypothetical protein
MIEACLVSIVLAFALGGSYALARYALALLKAKQACRFENVYNAINHCEKSGRKPGELRAPFVIADLAAAVPLVSRIMGPLGAVLTAIPIFVLEGGGVSATEVHSSFTFTPKDGSHPVSLVVAARSMTLCNEPAEPVAGDPFAVLGEAMGHAASSFGPGNW